MDRTSHVYIMASKSGVLYVGVTSNLAQRVTQHKEKQVPGFTQKYNVTKLVWFEPHSTIRSAIAREKEIKSWRRSKKTALIESLTSVVITEASLVTFTRFTYTSAKRTGF